MEEKPKRFRLNKIVVLILVILVVAAAGAAYFYKNQDKDSSASLPAGWSEYKNEKYGFKFTYPVDWGEPEIRESAGKSGKQFTIAFIRKTSVAEGNNQQFQNNQSIAISLDSEDLTAPCPEKVNNCPPIQVIDRAYIETQVKSNDGKFIGGRDFFTKVISLNEQRINGFSIYQVIALPKLKVSAAVGNLQLSESSDSCPATELSVDITVNCAQKESHDKLLRVLKSIEET